MMLSSWLTFVILARLAANTYAAIDQLGRGATANWQVAATFNVGHSLIAVLGLTFLISSVAVNEMTADRTRVAMAPVSFRAVLLGESRIVLSNPLNAIVVALLVPTVVQLAFLEHRLAAIAVYSVLSLSVYLVGWSTSFLFGLGTRFREGTRLLRIAFVTALVTLVTANPELLFGDDPEVLLFRSVRLPLPHTRFVTGSGPSSWAVLAGETPSGGGWLLLPAVGLVAAAGLFVCGSALDLYHRRILRPASRRRHRMANRPSPATLTARIFSVNLRSAVRTPEFLLSVVAAGASSWAILSNAADPLTIGAVGAGFVLVSTFSLTANMLGSYGRAIGRFMLAAPDWAKVMGAMTSAYAAAVALPLSMIFAAIATRFAVLEVMSWFVACGLVLLANACCGIVTSIAAPYEPRRRAGSRPSESPLLNYVIPIGTLGIALAPHLLSVAFGSIGFLAVCGTLAVAMMALYGMLLHRCRKWLDGEIEQVFARLDG